MGCTRALECWTGLPLAWSGDDLRLPLELGHGGGGGLGLLELDDGEAAPPPVFVERQLHVHRASVLRLHDETEGGIVNGTVAERKKGVNELAHWLSRRVNRKQSELVDFENEDECMVDYETYSTLKLKGGVLT